MTWGRGPFRLRTQKKSARRSSPRAFFYPFCGWGLLQRVQLRLPEPSLRVAGHPPRRHKVRMPLLPALRKAPAAPLLLLSPPGLLPRRGPRKWRLAGETSFSYSSVSSSACQRFIFASLGIRLVVTKSACLCFPPCGKRRLLPCSSSPHRGFCPAGGPGNGDWRGRRLFLIPACPAPPARDSSSRRWASASRRGETWPPCPPWGRPAGSCA